MASPTDGVFGAPLKMIDLEVFVPDIMSEVSDCPVPVIEKRLIEAAIEACERANLVRWQAPELRTRADRICYDVPVPSKHTAIHSIIRCYLNQNPIRNVPPIDTHDNVYNQLERYGTDGYFVPNRGQVQLGGNPQDSDLFTASPREIRGLDLFVSIKPTRTADELPKVLYDDYYNLIVAGTLARLFEMNDTFWTNEAKSERRHKEFEHEIARAKMQIDRGFTTKPNKLRPRRFV